MYVRQPDSSEFVHIPALDRLCNVTWDHGMGAIAPYGEDSLILYAVEENSNDIVGSFSSVTGLSDPDTAVVTPLMSDIHLTTELASTNYAVGGYSDNSAVIRIKFGTEEERTYVFTNGAFSTVGIATENKFGDPMTPISQYAPVDGKGVYYSFDTSGAQQGYGFLVSTVFDGAQPATVDTEDERQANMEAVYLSVHGDSGFTPVTLADSAVRGWWKNTLDGDSTSTAVSQILMPTLESGAIMTSDTSNPTRMIEVHSGDSTMYVREVQDGTFLQSSTALSLSSTSLPDTSVTSTGYVQIFGESGYPSGLFITRWNETDRYAGSNRYLVYREPTTITSQVETRAAPAPVAITPPHVVPDVVATDDFLPFANAEVPADLAFFTVNAGSATMVPQIATVGWESVTESGRLTFTRIETGGYTPSDEIFKSIRMSGTAAEVPSMVAVEQGWNTFVPIGEVESDEVVMVASVYDEAYSGSFPFMLANGPGEQHRVLWTGETGDWTTFGPSLSGLGRAFGATTTHAVTISDQTITIVSVDDDSVSNVTSDTIGVPSTGYISPVIIVPSGLTTLTAYFLSESGLHEVVVNATGIEETVTAATIDDGTVPVLFDGHYIVFVSDDMMYRLDTRGSSLITSDCPNISGSLIVSGHFVYAPTADGTLVKRCTPEQDDITFAAVPVEWSTTFEVEDIVAVQAVPVAIDLSVWAVRSASGTLALVTLDEAPMLSRNDGDTEQHEYPARTDSISFSPQSSVPLAFAGTVDPLVVGVEAGIGTSSLTAYRTSNSFVQMIDTSGMTAVTVAEESDSVSVDIPTVVAIVLGITTVVFFILYMIQLLK